MSLTGTVMKTEKELVNLKLDIDGPNGGYEYQYKWVPTTGNMMYCMPKLGTKASLFIAAEDEQEARVMNSPRENGSVHPHMTDYNYRALTTEHDKKMYFYPERMGYVGVGSEEVPLHIELSDLEHMLFQSHDKILIVAEQGIKFEAGKTLSIVSPLNIHVVRTDKAEDFQPIIVPFGTASNIPGLGGGGEESEEEEEDYPTDASDDTYLVMHYRFDLIGGHGIFQGWEFQTFPPFDDAPRVGTFCWIAPLAIIAVAVAVVAVTVVTFGAAAPILAGAVIGAAVSVAGVAVGDIISGNNSSLGTFVRAAVIGAITGAIGAGVGGKLACLFTKANTAFSGVTAKARIAKALVGAGTGAISGGVSGFVTGAAGEMLSQLLSGEGLNWGDVWSAAVRGAIQGAIMGGIMGAASGALRADPVNAVHGFVYYNTTDFEYPGVIPLKWERSWNSKNISLGPVGCGTGLSVGVYLIIERNITFVDKDGFSWSFEDVEPNTKTTNRFNKMSLSFDGEKYEIFNEEERLYYQFKQKAATNIYHLAQIETETRDHQISLNYNENAHLEKVVDTAGREFKVTTNETGQITEVVHNGKMLVRYHYDENLDLVKITGVNGNSSEISYENHLMVKRRTMEGTCFYWEYEGAGQDAKCVHTWGDEGLLDYTFEYSEGQTIVTNSLGHQEIFKYDKEYTLEKLVQENGSEIIYEHNEFKEITAITNADGEKTEFKYSEEGWLTEQIEASGGTHKIEYDEEGRVIKGITPLLAESIWSYDEEGYLIEHKTPIGELEKYTYDQGLLVEIKEGEAESERITKLDYDRDLNLAKITYPTGAEESFEYDREGNITKAINPLGAIETMTYDKGNRLVKHIDSDGNTTELKYNAYDDVVWLKDSEREISFKYDVLGNLTNRMEQHRKIKMSYDTEGQLSIVENEAGEIYKYERDEMGNVSSETGYDNVRKLYSYTKAGKLKGIKRGNTADWIRMRYGKDGYLSKVTYDDGTDNPEEEHFIHGQAGELLKAENNHIKLEFEYNKLGNVTKEIQNGHVIESSYSKDYTHKSGL